MVGHDRKLPEHRFSLIGELDICWDFRHSHFVEPEQIAAPQAAPRTQLDPILIAQMLPSI